MYPFNVFACGVMRGPSVMSVLFELKISILLGILIGLIFLFRFNHFWKNLSKKTKLILRKVFIFIVFPVVFVWITYFVYLISFKSMGSYIPLIVPMSSGTMFLRGIPTSIPEGCGGYKEILLPGVRLLIGVLFGLALGLIFANYHFCKDKIIKRKLIKFNILILATIFVGVIFVLYLVLI